MVPELVTKGWALGASGLAVVWSRENTPEAIFDVPADIFANEKNISARGT